MARRYVKKLREVSGQQKLYVEDFLKAVAECCDAGLVRQENIIKQEKMIQEQELQSKCISQSILVLMYWSILVELLKRIICCLPANAGMYVNVYMVYYHFIVMYYLT